MSTSTTRKSVPETSPATEWLLGGPIQKVSPRYRHGRMQLLAAARLDAWARGRGRVATEWRVWLSPEGEEEERYLVPDVAYLSYARLPAAAVEAAEEPALAPELVIEIRSREDRDALIDHKIDVYLRSGTLVVCVLDPYARCMSVADRHARFVLEETDSFSHPGFPGFTLPLPELFADLDEPFQPKR